MFSSVRKSPESKQIILAFLWTWFNGIFQITEDVFQIGHVFCMCRDIEHALNGKITMANYTWKCLLKVSDMNCSSNQDEKMKECSRGTKIVLKQNWNLNKDVDISGQSYKTSTIVIYDSRVVPDWKIPHITTLES